jgi:hypothetical protein
MRVLFVENRGKTAFWERVALRMQGDGHEIAWLVQNPVFAPSAFAHSDRMRVLPFPPRAGGRTGADEDAFVRQHYPALLTDRGRRYFGAGVGHYAHYASEIQRSLNEAQPDLVVGESTLFHELIAIDCCRASGVPYVQPVANRYPRGRFSLFAYDTQHAVAGSGDSLPEGEARALAERIASGREVPFYMRVPGPLEKALSRSKWALSRGRVWWGRLRGERYNTPSLWCKVSLERQVRGNLRRWRRLERVPASPTRTLLYPLQLQPEANIDVWGRPYSDQVTIIRDLLAIAPRDVEVAVKANPKAKYELSDELLRLAESNPRLCLLPVQMTMPESLARVTGAITATGTIGIEAVFGKGRCLSLRHPLIEKEFPEFHADSLAKATQRLLSEPSAGVGNVELGTRLLRHFVAQSFAGLVSEPLLHPACMDRGNIEAVARALETLLMVSNPPFWKNPSVSQVRQGVLA